MRRLALAAGLLAFGAAPAIAARISTGIATSIATRPISRMDTPWWHARFLAKQAELKRGPAELLWLGDSITQNWETDGPQDWRRFLPVWTHYYGDRHAIDLGFKGDSTCHLLWRIENGELDGIAPKAAIILIGANNFGHIHTDADQTYAGIVTVVDAVHRRLPNTRILLLGVLPSIRSAWVTQNTARLNERLASQIRAGRPYVTYRDVGGLFLTDGHVDANRFLDPDLQPPDPPLHPTAQSQARIAAAIEPDVAAMLGDQIHR
jgi:lysophospholipase L1-like esterase